MRTSRDRPASAACPILELKERLRDEPLPERARGWLPELRGRFARGLPTRRGRGLSAGSAFAAAAAVLAIMFIAGVFSSPSEQVRVPGASPSTSEQVRIELPSDTTFQITATMADAIGVDPETEFVLTSAENLPVDTVRALPDCPHGHLTAPSAGDRRYPARPAGRAGGA